MPTNYPAALDDGTTLPTTRVDSTPILTSHPADHDNAAAAIQAVEAKIGIGTSTPANGLVLTGGAAAGSSTWQTVVAGSGSPHLGTGADTPTSGLVLTGGSIAGSSTWSTPGTGASPHLGTGADTPTSGLVLTGGATAGSSVWSTAPVGGTGGPMATVTVTTSYTVLTNDVIIRCNLTAAANITLPASVLGKEYRIKKVDATASIVTIVGTVDNIVNPTLVTQNDGLILVGNGSSYDSW